MAIGREQRGYGRACRYELGYIVTAHPACTKQRAAMGRSVLENIHTPPTEGVYPVLYAQKTEAYLVSYGGRVQSPGGQQQDARPSPQQGRTCFLVLA